MKEEDFAAQLREAFMQEAQEQLQIVVSGLLQLEEEAGKGTDKRLVEKMFRQVHNLKGSARATGFTTTERICQLLESAFALLRTKSIALTSKQLDVLHRAVALVQITVFGALNSVEDSQLDSIEVELETLTTELSAPGGKAGEEVNPSPSSEAPVNVNTANMDAESRVQEAPLTNTVKISAERLDEVISQAEEFLAFSAISHQIAAELLSLREHLEDIEGIIERNTSRIRSVASLSSQLQAQNLTDDTVSKQISSNLAEQTNRITDSQHLALSKVHNAKHKLAEAVRYSSEQVRNTGLSLDTFLRKAKQLMIVPCATLLDSFPASIRALARDLGKEVELTIVGADIMLDKRIINQLRDPLNHLVRNAVDHGIETPEERERSGKKRKAKLDLQLRQIDASTVEITVTDDGAGINLEKVKAAALKQGLLPENSENLTQEQALDLVFTSALSTANIITDISGRGLGLAIVKDAILSFGGKIAVSSELGKGTQFKLTVPVSLATFRGLFLEAAGQQFVIPTANFLRVLRVEPAAVKNLGDKDSILFNERYVPVARLAQLLALEELPQTMSASSFLNVAVVAHNTDVLPLIVDNVVDEHEVLVKSLGAPLEYVRNVAGVTILGSGKVVPVLNVADLVANAKGTTYQVNRGPRQAPSAKHVLVVDDTLTARLMMKNILDGAGFLVETAGDGVEALDMLELRPYDLVITDLEMPRMTGFELTAAIRANDGLADMPVVIVTALATKEDRERGVDVGANAYFVKSSFDQSNLLEVVNRLI